MSIFFHFAFVFRFTTYCWKELDPLLDSLCNLLKPLPSWFNGASCLFVEVYIEFFSGVNGNQWPRPFWFDAERKKKKTKIRWNFHAFYQV